MTIKLKETIFIVGLPLAMSITGPLMSEAEAHKTKFHVPNCTQKSKQERAKCCVHTGTGAVDNCVAQAHNNDLTGLELVDCIEICMGDKKK